MNKEIILPKIQFHFVLLTQSNQNILQHYHWCVTISIYNSQ